MILKTASLQPEAKSILCEKQTEQPFRVSPASTFLQEGTALCRRCGRALFRAKDQFQAGCGWPSFDEEIPGSVSRLPDPDGRRTEILCSCCQGHLGHVFLGEGYTHKNIRYCVNSLSLDWVSDSSVLETEEAVFAAGCFWGVEFYFRRLAGVLKVEVGYTGGQAQWPTYQTVCQTATGHFEAVRVLYQPSLVNYEDVVRYFFEIHDPCQTDGQGPDKGNQYLSAIFYYDAEQQKTAERLMGLLVAKGYPVATKILPVSVFWSGEDFHQNYYARKQETPYCHTYVKKF